MENLSPGSSIYQAVHTLLYNIHHGMSIATLLVVKWMPLLPGSSKFSIHSVVPPDITLNGAEINSQHNKKE